MQSQWTLQSLHCIMDIQVFNGVASAGLSASILIVPLFNKNEAYLAVGSLSLAMIFAGKTYFFITEISFRNFVSN